MSSHPRPDWRSEMQARQEEAAREARLYGPHALHEMHVVPTGEESLHSSRPRYRVVCVSCGVEVHPGTNGPKQRVTDHLEGRDEGIPMSLGTFMELSTAEIELIEEVLSRVEAVDIGSEEPYLVERRIEALLERIRSIRTTR